MASNKTLVVDYSYYLGRVDRLYLTKDGFFTVKEGTPSRLPKLPLPNEEPLKLLQFHILLMFVMQIKRLL